MVPLGWTAASELACTAVPASCLSMRARAARACWCTVSPARTAGWLARRQTNDPLDLVGQAEGFGVADGGGQHGLGEVLVSRPGEHFSGGDRSASPDSTAARASKTSPAACRRVIIDLESLPEPDDPRSRMPGLAQLVAVHAQHQPEQRPVT
jgi:hypothetical protein